MSEKALGQALPGLGGESRNSRKKDTFRHFSAAFSGFLLALTPIRLAFWRNRKVFSLSEVRRKASLLRFSPPTLEYTGLKKRRFE